MQTPHSIDPSLRGLGDEDHADIATRTAASAVDSGMESLVRGIDSATETIRERAEDLPGGEAIANAAYSVADSLESGADYLADRTVEDIVDDVKQIVKRHPGATLLAAGALGFLIARAFNRR